MAPGMGSYYPQNPAQPIPPPAPPQASIHSGLFAPPPQVSTLGPKLQARPSRRLQISAPLEPQNLAPDLWAAASPRRLSQGANPPGRSAAAATAAATAAAAGTVQETASEIPAPTAALRAPSPAAPKPAAGLRAAAAAFTPGPAASLPQKAALNAAAAEFTPGMTGPAAPTASMPVLDTEAAGSVLLDAPKAGVVDEVEEFSGDPVVAAVPVKPLPVYVQQYYAMKGGLLEAVSLEGELSSEFFLVLHASSVKGFQLSVFLQLAFHLNYHFQSGERFFDPAIH